MRVTDDMDRAIYRAAENIGNIGSRNHNVIAAQLRAMIEELPAPAPTAMREDEALDWCLNELERLRYADGKDWPEVVKARAELAALRSRQSPQAEDEYHTLDELYEHRFALTRALVALIPDKCVKCKKNGDGSTWEGFFVVYIETPAGQISYHYKLEHWDELPCREVAQWHYDGHTPAITLDRLASIAARPSPQGEDALLTVLDDAVGDLATDGYTTYARAISQAVDEITHLRARLAATADAGREMRAPRYHMGQEVDLRADDGSWMSGTISGIEPDYWYRATFPPMGRFPGGEIQGARWTEKQGVPHTIRPRAAL